MICGVSKKLKGPGVVLPAVEIGLLLSQDRARRTKTHSFVGQIENGSRLDSQQYTVRRQYGNEGVKPAVQWPRRVAVTFSFPLALHKHDRGLEARHDIQGHAFRRAPIRLRPKAVFREIRQFVFEQEKGGAVGGQKPELEIGASGPSQKLP